MINFLDPIATKIFVSIYNQLNAAGCLTLDNANGVHEPLQVKKLDEISLHSKKLERISFGHYYEDGGKIMADPEMIFLFNPDYPEKIAPCFFKMDALGKIENSIIFNEDGDTIEMRTKMQKGHTAFADVWMNSIMKQQSILI